MKPADLAPLLAIAASVDAAAQVRLGTAIAAERETRARLAALDAAAGDTGQPLSLSELAARAAHDRWKARRREVLLQDQARQRSAVEVARMEATRALGRKEAIAALLETAQKEHARLRASRQLDTLSSLPRLRDDR
ncbi:MAG: hypothetical protein MUF73_01665 [Rhodobacteraceae bacterium]|jgi:hypothetical protein|nr:hypothetical protein [Paracoccaceae bacterium]